MIKYLFLATSILSTGYTFCHFEKNDPSQDLYKLGYSAGLDEEEIDAYRETQAERARTQAAERERVRQEAVFLQARAVYLAQQANQLQPPAPPRRPRPADFDQNIDRRARRRIDFNNQ